MSIARVRSITKENLMSTRGLYTCVERKLFYRARNARHARTRPKRVRHHGHVYTHTQTPCVYVHNIYASIYVDVMICCSHNDRYCICARIICLYYIAYYFANARGVGAALVRLRVCIHMLSVILFIAIYCVCAYAGILRTRYRRARSRARACVCKVFACDPPHTHTHYERNMWNSERVILCLNARSEGV